MGLISFMHNFLFYFDCGLKCDRNVLVKFTVKTHKHDIYLNLLTAQMITHLNRH